VFTLVLEVEAGPSDEVNHGSRNEDVTGPSHTLNTLGEMHCDTGHIVSTPLDLTCVQASSNVEAELKDGIADRRRTPDSPSRPVEGGEHPVAGSLHEMPAKSGELTVNSPIVQLEAFVPGLVSEGGRLPGRVLDVGEEHCGKLAICGGELPLASQELFDLASEVGVTRPRNVVGSW
jgi:hypothetical protein